MIKLEKISLTYDKSPVLDRLTHTFEGGAVHCIVGESGVGKTSLLGIISGLVASKGGKVELSSERIAYVFQEPRLFPWLTSLDNVSEVCGGDKEKAARALCALGLADALDKYPSELSGGMKQRVSIARALCYDADIFLLDEPFGALDGELHASVAKFFFESVRGKTVIMVTHDERDLAFADTVHKLTKAPLSRLERL